MSAETTPDPKRFVLSAADLRKGSIWVAQFVGVVAGGGGSFTALSFGIAYLAIKHHDEMLGIPTTLTTYTSYVRTGALFFPNSVHYVVSAITGHVWTVLLPILIGVILVPILLSRPQLKTGATLSTILLLVSYAGIILFALHACQWQAAAFDPANKNLLLSSSQKPSDPFAQEIHNHLLVVDANGNSVSSTEAAGNLQRLFGFQLVRFLFIGLVAIVLLVWEQHIRDDLTSISTSSASAVATQLAVTTWFLKPVLYGLLAIQILVLPASYGVLCLPNNLPCLSVELTDDSERSPGQLGEVFLLSDLSTELEEVRLIIATKEKNVIFKAYSKDQIREFTVMRNCLNNNILALMH